MVEEKTNPVGPFTKGKMVKDNTAPAVSVNTTVQPEIKISGRSLRGVVRGSGRGAVTSDAIYVGPSANSGVTFRTDASALGSYTPPAPTVSGKRRLSGLEKGLAVYLNKELLDRLSQQSAPPQISLQL